MGTVRISFDFENGWGAVNNGYWRVREAAGVYEDLRPALKRLVAQLDTLEMSFAWAVVGAMIEDQQKVDMSHLKGAYGVRMAEFLADSTPTTRDGRDLLDIVTNAGTTQVFGSHTYSHLLYSDPEQNASVIRRDLELSAKSNLTAGIAADILVFPQNEFGYFAEAAEAGIRSARMPAHNVSTTTQKPSLIGRAVSSFTRPTSEVVELRDPSGLTLHYASEFLNWGAKAGAVKRMSTIRRLNRALDVASKGGDVHFWLHPFNLAETPGLADFMETFLNRIAALRDKGLVETAAF